MPRRKTKTSTESFSPSPDMKRVVPMRSGKVRLYNPTNTHIHLVDLNDVDDEIIEAFRSHDPSRKELHNYAVVNGFEALADKLKEDN